MATAPPTYAPTGFAGTYPINLQVDQPSSFSRLYAIPVLGIVLRAIMLIPHAIALSILGLVVAISQLVLWFSVVSSGHYPEWGQQLVGGTLRWAARVMAFYYGLTDQYPPFSLGNDGAPYPVNLTFEAPQAGRFWAIPIVGYVARYIVLIPHLIVLYALGIVVGLTHLVAWFSVLTRGEYPSWAWDLTKGYIQWSSRTGAFFLGLTDTYPPFAMGN